MTLFAFPGCCVGIEILFDSNNDEKHWVKRDPRCIRLGKERAKHTHYRVPILSLALGCRSCLPLLFIARLIVVVVIIISDFPNSHEEVPLNSSQLKREVDY